MFLGHSVCYTYKSWTNDISFKFTQPNRPSDFNFLDPLGLFKNYKIQDTSLCLPNAPCWRDVTP